MAPGCREAVEASPADGEEGGDLGDGEESQFVVCLGRRGGSVGRGRRVDRTVIVTHLDPITRRCPANSGKR